MVVPNNYWFNAKNDHFGVFGGYHYLVVSDIFFFISSRVASLRFAAWMGREKNDIFYFHLYLGKVSILTNIFQMG